MANIQALIENLYNLDDAVWEEHNYNSRPTGNDREVYFADITKRINDTLDVDAIEKNYDCIHDALERNNYHSLNAAIAIVLGNTTIEHELKKEKAFQY